MGYCISKTVAAPFEETIQRVTALLKEQGFGVLTEIDVKETLKQKLSVDFRPYRILGACNPSLAHRALQVESNIGTMLPCNVVVQERAPGETVVAAINPTASMEAIGNDELGEIAKQVAAKLHEVLERV